MSEVLWYWQHDGEVNGPVGWRALEALAEQGQLLPGDLVRRAGGAVWVAAREAKKAHDAEMAARAAAQNSRPISQAAPARQGVGAIARPGAIDLNDLLEPSERIHDDASQRDLYRASDPLSRVLTEPGAQPHPAPPPRPAPVQRPARARPVQQDFDGPSGAEIAAVLRQRQAVSYGSTALVSCACVGFGLFTFGVAFGLIGMLLGGRALQGMYASGNPRGRGLAITAMIAGLAEAIYFSRTVLVQLAQSLNLV